MDGFDWVMVPNVIGMSQYADGGLMATKPCTSGGRDLDEVVAQEAARGADPP